MLEKEPEYKAVSTLHKRCVLSVTQKDYVQSSDLHVSKFASLCFYRNQDLAFETKLNLASAEA